MPQVIAGTQPARWRDRPTRESWKRVGPHFHNGKFYVFAQTGSSANPRTSCSVFISDDEGETWTRSVMPDISSTINGGIVDTQRLDDTVYVLLRTTTSTGNAIRIQPFDLETETWGTAVTSAEDVTLPVGGTTGPHYMFLGVVDHGDYCVLHTWNTSVMGTSYLRNRVPRYNGSWNFYMNTVSTDEEFDRHPLASSNMYTHISTGEKRMAFFHRILGISFNPERRSFFVADTNSFVHHSITTYEVRSISEFPESIDIAGIYGMPTVREDTGAWLELDEAGGGTPRTSGLRVYGRHVPSPTGRWYLYSRDTGGVWAALRESITVTGNWIRDLSAQIRRLPATGFGTPSVHVQFYSKAGWLGASATISRSLPSGSAGDVRVHAIQVRMNGETWHFDASQGLTNDGWTNPSNAYDNNTGTSALGGPSSEVREARGDGTTHPGGTATLSGVVEARAYTSGSDLSPAWSDWSTLVDTASSTEVQTAVDIVSSGVTREVSGIALDADNLAVVWSDDNNETYFGLLSLIASTPEDFQATQGPEGGILLGWSPSDNADSYELERERWNRPGDPP